MEEGKAGAARVREAEAVPILPCLLLILGRTLPLSFCPPAGEEERGR